MLPSLKSSGLERAFSVSSRFSNWRSYFSRWRKNFVSRVWWDRFVISGVTVVMYVLNWRQQLLTWSWSLRRLPHSPSYRRRHQTGIISLSHVCRHPWQYLYITNLYIMTGLSRCVVTRVAYMVGRTDGYKQSRRRAAWRLVPTMHHSRGQDSGCYWLAYT